MIYVASPYTHKKKEVMQQRYEDVCKFCCDAVQNGYFVYSPIVHWHPIAEKYDLPTDETWWKEPNEEVIKVCTQLWVLKLDKWQFSKGLKREILFANNNAVRVKYISEGGLSCIT